MGKHSSLNTLFYGSEVTVEPKIMEDVFNVQVQMSGRTVTTCGKDTNTIEPGFAAVLSPSQYVRMDWTHDSKMTIFSVAREAIERTLMEIFENHLSRPVTFAPVMQVGSAHASSFWRLLQFLQNEMQQTGLALHAPQAELHLEKCLIHSLLFTQEHNYSDALRRGLSAAVPKHVKRAEEYFHCNIHKKLTIDELAAAAGVSGRTLFVAFKKFRGASPVKYLGDIRMEKFREGLLAARSAQNTVKDVASNFGYTQLGRLSVEYKRKFGESPSETLRSRQICAAANPG